MMKFILDRSLSDLGIESVVIGIAKNVNPHAELSPTFLKKKKEREEGESSLVRSDGGVDRNKYKRLEMPIFSGEHLNS